MGGFTTSFLGLNILFSGNAMWGLLYRNGYYDAMIRLRDHGPHFLPGSRTPILTIYTGIEPLDKLATFSVVFFANVTDGSSPQESLFALHFAGQLASILTIIMIEAIRSGNKRLSLAWPAVWGVGMQIMGYGCVMPFYAICHLLTSPTASHSKSEVAREARISNISALENLLPSIAFGYILPTVLMAIPFHSSNLHQWLCGFWQGYPIWVPLVQFGLGRWQHREVAHPASQDSQSDTRNSSQDGAISMIHLRRAYLFSFGAAAVTHISVFAVLAVRQLYPTLFSLRLQQTLTFSNVFVPPAFYSNAPVSNLATSILNFFQYDQYGGSFGATFWTLILYHRAQSRPGNWAELFSLLASMLVVGCIAGPSGVYTWLLWRRDETALGDLKKE